MTKRRKPVVPVPLAPAAPPRTGVGTPDGHEGPAGAALGGDTGDVVVPHAVEEADGEGSPHGASRLPQATTTARAPGRTSRVNKAA